MPEGVNLTVVLCTYNRAEALSKTLQAFRRVRAPEGGAELLVVDNASTDHTAETVRAAGIAPWKLHYHFEPNRGKCHALNTALKIAAGEILLFTDDDVVLAEDWAEQLVAPIRKGRCDAVTGRMVLAPHLVRQWFSPMHSMWLALSLDEQSRDWSRELIGASMGIHRRVLQRVHGFDPELGPGPKGLGFCEDTLFGWQVAEAGFKIEHIPQAMAVHHLDQSRLQRRFWLDDAGRRGRTSAYLLHHWEHGRIPWAGFKARLYDLKLRLRRAAQPPQHMNSEGCPTWEMSYVMNREKCRQFCDERRRRHNYDRRGLVKHVR